jgi:excisionase family DNA binding protein
MLDALEALYDVTAVAQHFDVHPMSVRRWVREGRLPARRVGTKLRFTQADLEVFLRPASGPWRKGAAGSND